MRYWTEAIVAKAICSTGNGLPLFSRAYILALVAIQAQNSCGHRQVEQQGHAYRATGATGSWLQGNWSCGVMAIRQ